MSKLLRSNLSNLNQSESALARAEVELQLPSVAAGAAPGIVIPGERMGVSSLPESGESYTFPEIGAGNRFIAHPLPHPEVPSYAAITDYLNCTFLLKPEAFSQAIFLDELAKAAGAHFRNVRNRGKGMNGYEKSFDLGNDGAKFCIGGQRDTALLMLPGKVCHTVTDWPALVELLRDHHGARITRWDGAVDDFEGVHSVDWAVGQYHAGNFKNGGNKPSCKQNGNWIDPDGTGRTFYVGKRENGKLLRVYEKGMQCCHEWHPWVRWEVELHNVDRVIPWDVLLNPGQYVAGAYPKALSWIQEEMCRIRTIQNEAKLSYQHLIECASIAYGRLINTMLEVEGSPDQVLQKLRKDGLPKRLQMPVVAKKD